MSRRGRARAWGRRAALGWPVGIGILLLLAVGGWYFAAREAPSGTQGGRSIASYRPPDVHALAVHPTDANVVIFGSHRGMLISRDGGKAWEPIGPTGDAMGIAMPPGSGTAYAAGHDVFFRSDDGGETWAPDTPALPGTDIHGFAASAVRPGRFYAYVHGHGLFWSVDGGRTWTRSGTAPTSTMSLAVAKASEQDVLLASTGEGVQRSRDGGATWERVREVGSAYVGASGARVYAAAGTRVFVSNDAGTRWEQRTFNGGKAALVAASAKDPETVYVVTEDLTVWRSTDGARSWQRVS